MAIEIKVPDMGESVIEATVARWMKQEGESVRAGEPVVELETDKVNLEVGAQHAGVLQKIRHAAGDTVKVGDVLAVVAEDGEAEATPAKSEVTKGAAAAEKTPSAAPEKAAPAAKATTQNAPPAPADKAQAPAAPAEPAASTAVAATPVAMRMALDYGLDLARIKPSGAGGRVTKEDIEAYLKAAVRPEVAEVRPANAEMRLEVAEVRPPEAQPEATPTQPPAPTVTGGKSPEELSRPPAPAPAPATAPVAAPQPVSTDRETVRETRVRLSRRRQTIARRLVEAQHTAAMLTTFNEIDMSRVMELRKRRREGFKERYGVDLGYMSFFVKASIGALKAFPEVNSELALSETSSELVLKHYYDIGIAIGAEEGLVVPVVRDADRLNFAGIEKAIKDFAQKAKDGTLTLDDLRGGTFTITNGGIYGSLMSTPILNPPQVAILGMHAIKERPVVVGGEMVIRPMMYVALSYDHRVVDGREAVQFLVRIKELVEDPESLLFG